MTRINKLLLTLSIIKVTSLGFFSTLLISEIKLNYYLSILTIFFFGGVAKNQVIYSCPDTLPSSVIFSNKLDAFLAFPVNLRNLYAYL